MGPYAGLLARDGIEYLRHSMPNVITHNVADKQTSDKDTHYRIKQIEVVGLIGIEVLRKEMLYKVNQSLQRECRKSRTKAYEHRKHKRKGLGTDMLLAPLGEADKPRNIPRLRIIHNQ